MTSILAGLSQNCELARFHSTFQTTNRYYLDKSSVSLIDNVFQLPELEDFMANRDILRENSILDLTGLRPTIKEFESETMPEFDF